MPTPKQIVLLGSQVITKADLQSLKPNYDNSKDRIVDANVENIIQEVVKCAQLTTSYGKGNFSTPHSIQFQPSNLDYNSIKQFDILNYTPLQLKNDVLSKLQQRLPDCQIDVIEPTVQYPYYRLTVDWS